MTEPKTVTLLIPAYNEANALPRLFERIEAVINIEPGYRFEYLVVDDGSSDGTLAEIKQLATQYLNVEYISFARNFGKEYALAAGFQNAKGDAVIILDGDGQHPPELIPDMLRLWEIGYDDVYAVRQDAVPESFPKKVARSVYYKFADAVVGKDIIVRNAGDFRLLDRKCVIALRNLTEADRNTKALYGWVGFRKVAIEYQQGERAHGASKWDRRSLVKLASSGIISFSVAPLRIALWAGFLVSIAAFAYLAIVIIQTIAFGDRPDGYPTIVSLLLFLCGTILITVGIVGEYVGRIFDEVKRRPLYLVKDANVPVE